METIYSKCILQWHRIQKNYGSFNSRGSERDALLTLDFFFLTFSHFFYMQHWEKDVFWSSILSTYY